MAPKAKFWRHQLGKSTICRRHPLLYGTLPLFLLLIACFTTQIEARTEPDTWSELSISFLTPEKISHAGSQMLTSLSPPFAVYNISPVGRSRNRVPIHIPNEPSVRKYIQYYRKEGRATLAGTLKRSSPYVPVMAEILESNGVPAEMIAIVMVESSFKARAAYRGAAGYWQLLPGTARSLGLRVDRWVDERADPIKSTQAAAKYLRSFYDQYQCWTLAIAAYNTGDAPVTRAVRKYNANDFWELHRKSGVPSRSRTYVPKVLAAMHILRNLEAHGFEYPRNFPVYDFESIWVNSPLKLEQVAQWINVPIGQIRDLNSSLVHDRVPPENGFALRLPSGTRDKFDLAYEDYLKR